MNAAKLIDKQINEIVFRKSIIYTHIASDYDEHTLAGYSIAVVSR